MTNFGLNFAMQTVKTVQQLMAEAMRDDFLDCDNAFIRSSTIMAIVPAQQQTAEQAQATEILNTMDPKGVTPQ